MQTTNPFLGEKTFSNLRPSTGVMTIQGTVEKLFALLTLSIMIGWYTWSFYGDHPALHEYRGLVNLATGLIGTAIAFLLVYKKHWAPIMAMPYAAIQGVFMGSLTYSLVAGRGYTALIALLLTFLTLFGLLLAYRSGLIKVTENFKLGAVSVTFAFVVGQILMSWYYGASEVFKVHNLPILLFELVIIVIAAVNLVLDFDFIESGVDNRAPEYMEWYGAFSIMVTMIWLYISVLRMLTRRNSSD